MVFLYVKMINWIGDRDGATWGPKGAMAPAGSKKKAKVGIKN